MIIKNGIIVTWKAPNQILKGHSIRIKNGNIAEILPDAQIEPEIGEEICDAHSQLIMPGNICAHTHFYGAFARGLSTSGNPPSNFTEILEQLWWKLDRTLDKNDIDLSTKVCVLDAIRHGTTTLIDHHASPSYINGSLQVIEDACRNAGVRACLCYEVTDRGGEKKTIEGIEENANFIKRTQKNPDSKITAMFGLHAGLTLSNKTLEKCREATPENVGFHIHVAEDPIDEYNSLQNYKMRVVDRLSNFGILSSNSILAHAVHVDVRELEIIKENECWVTHQPRSNMNNAVGVADVEGMLRLGIPVCLGNDGFSNSMWDEWKTTYLVHKLTHRDPRKMPADVITQIAIYNNARLVSRLFNNMIGVFEPGAKADLIFVDYKPYTEMTINNLPWHIIFGFRESMITSTMANGEFLMKDRQVLTMDEEKIICEAQKASQLVWKRFSTLKD